MSSPKVFIEDLMARKAGLVEQLRLLENHLADPQRSPSFGTHSNHEPTTKESIGRAKAQIAELDDLIAKVGMPEA